MDAGLQGSLSLLIELTQLDVNLYLRSCDQYKQLLYIYLPALTSVSSSLKPAPTPKGPQKIDFHLFVEVPWLDLNVRRRSWRLIQSLNVSPTPTGYQALSTPCYQVNKCNLRL